MTSPASNPLTAPTQLWQFLGTTPGKPFVPFPAQAELLGRIAIPWRGMVNGKPTPRIYGVNCGRRFGKSTMASVLLWHGLVAADDQFGPPTVRVTADTEEHGRKIWDRFTAHLNRSVLGDLVETYSKERELVTLKTGATAQLISANNPGALAGDGVTLWLVDEAQYLTEAAYENLFPSTSDRMGVIVMFGVAEGSGPFREVCYKGDRRSEYPEFMRLRYPTWANPMISKDAIASARREYTPAQFKRLYEAEWVTQDGQLFTGVRDCVIQDAPTPKLHPGGWGYIEEPKSTKHYYAGVDLARTRDWTVVVILDHDRRLVAWDRFHRVSWAIQRERIQKIMKAYRLPLSCIDATAIGGDMMTEDLQAAGMNVMPYAISSNQKKHELIDKLVIAISSKRVSYPHIPVLIRELERMEAVDRGGVVRYSAPSGGTDDFVLALALALQAAPTRTYAFELGGLPPDMDEGRYRPWAGL